MKSEAVFVLSLLIAGVLCHPPNRARLNIEVGEPCIPKNLESCGEPDLLMETSTPVANGYGTNVCHIEKNYSVPVYSYEYKETCKKRKCSISCESTGNCNSTEHFTKSKITCCEGFTTAQTTSSDDHCTKHRCPKGKSKRGILREEGCPREILPTVLDCLHHLNLGPLANAFLTMEFDILILNDADISLFAPSIEPDRSLFGDKDVSVILGTHILNKTIFAAHLEDGNKLQTLSEGLYLHISQTKKNNEEILFVNGMELTERDACIANNGIVHVIEGFILAEERTIAEAMASIAELSVLSSLFQTAGFDELEIYKSGCKLKTLFAPTDEAFADFDLMDFELIDLVECLLMEQNGKILQQFLKSHISNTAHYSRSLALQKEVEVLSTAKRMRHYHQSSYTHHHHHHLKKHKNMLEVQVTNNTIQLGSDGAEVVQADISASNGVIHLISSPLFTSMLNLNELCPVAPNHTEVSTTTSTTTTTSTITTTTTTNARTENPTTTTTTNARTENPTTITNARTEKPTTTPNARSENPTTTTNVPTEDPTIEVPEGGK